jgi:hypothetical protein
MLWTMNVDYLIAEKEVLTLWELKSRFLRSLSLTFSALQRARDVNRFALIS